MTKKEWIPSEYPRGSFHLEMGECGARIKLIPHIGYWEWSSWIGPPGKRVMHDRNESKSKAAAKKAAEKSCATIMGK
jgi:hypothetical protein